MKNVLAVSILLFAFSAAQAQVSTGSLGGSITDPNNAIVPGASISVRNEATGVEQKTTSSDAGLYVFPTLNPGIYGVSVEKPGFKRGTRGNIEIRIAQRLDLNLQLEVGDVQQTVTITGEAPLLETSTPERGQNISSTLMDNLPLFSGGIRNPRNFVNYMPGVTNNGELSVSGSGGRAQEVPDRRRQRAQRGIERGLQLPVLGDVQRVQDAAKQLLGGVWARRRRD